MSLRTPEPSTRPPRSRYGERLDRYSRYEPIACPCCGETGIDIWLSEGAVTARGVCVSSGCEIDEPELVRALEEGDA